MRNRSVGLTLFASLAVVVSACTGGTSPSPTGTATGTPPASPTEPSASESAAPTPVQADLKIGVVTDVGTVNDKNFNEFTFVGAKEGAASIGSAEPQVTVPKDDSEYASAIQAYIDQDYDVIVSTGFNLAGPTTQAAHDNPDVWFIGVDQGGANYCITPEGLPDTTFQCAGNADGASLLPKYAALWYQEDQPGYLAGMVAASVSETGEIGAIGGITLCTPCVRYIQGYALGAKAVNPDVKVRVAWVTESDFTKAFNDPDGGKNFAQQFMAQFPQVDVLFQVAGKTGNGVLDAACDAGKKAIGVDVDQALSYPSAASCIVVSAEKKLALSVSSTVQAIAAETAKGGEDLWDAERDGIGISPFHEFENEISADLKTKLDEALAEMKAGTLETCPDNCGTTPAPPIGD